MPFGTANSSYAQPSGPQLGTETRNRPPLAAAWVVLVGVLLYVGFNADDPGLPLLLFLMSVGVTVLGLLLVVMRALLRQATTLRTDMEAVI
jgi:CHASE1-domain containing sensor protein